MAGLWIVAVSALLVAVAALLHARRTARQLAQVTEMYWQLKFEHGELKAKLEPESKPNFIPLTQLKR